MTYIIAEVGGNHDGNIELAKELVREAKEAGCNAVKFQTYDADKLVHPEAQALPQAKGYTKQVDRFKDLQFTEAQWLEIIDICKRYRIDFLTTCFDLESLEKYAPYMKAIKVASGDLTYTRLLRAAAQCGKPVLLSTGMSSYSEIEYAASYFDPNLLTVLHCVSIYPCSDENANLGVIRGLQGIYSSVGYSDHTQGITAAIAAAAMGCRVIEKHFTHDSTLDYGDHSLSLEPEDMAVMVHNIRRIEKMSGFAKPDPLESDNRDKMRRGAYAAKEINIGQVISEDDILCIRPKTRRNASDLVGKRARKDFKPLDAING